MKRHKIQLKNLIIIQLIYEIRGLGIAFIKNVILNGLEKVTIFVSEIAKIKDMNSNFFFDESIL